MKQRQPHRHDEDATSPRLPGGPAGFLPKPSQNRRLKRTWKRGRK